jgi:hypothetical protein
VRSILSSGLRTIELLRPGDAGGTEGATPVRDRMAATHLLRSFARDPLNVGVLRRTLAVELGAQRVARMADQEVVDRLARQVAGGRIQVASLAASRAAVPRRSLVWEHPFAGQVTEEKVGNDQEAATGGGAAAATPEPTQTAASWIRFRVIDDATDQPVAGVTLTLKLPDGKTQDVTSGDDGVIELKGLPSGTCDIQKMSDSEAWEVVQIG